MDNKFLFFLMVSLFFGQIIAQNINNESMAREYYREGNFKEASELFENIYKQKKVKSIYDKYIDCLIRIQSYKKAEKTIKSFYRKTKNPNILIDLGKVALLKGDRESANENFNLALKEAKNTKKFLPTIGAKFFKEKEYKLALKAYLLAKKENKKSSYYIQIANIHSYLGDIKSMYNELIELINLYPHYLQTCKNKIRRTITEYEESQNNKILKKVLLKSIQGNNSYEASKMLVWLCLQERKFDQALEYEISVDKRFNNNTNDIIKLAEVAIANKKYETATKGFQYILKNSAKNSYEYEYSNIKILDIEFDILENKKIKKKSEIIDLKEAHEKLLEDFGVKSETIFILKNYCRMLGRYLNNEEKAIQILEDAINNNYLNEHDIAICKMELADMLISYGNMWEAILLYSQVEKKFKDDIIGHKAKFEKTKINYYQGDFEWAQNQLKVLKLSTSKLIANDAMKLSLLISDNLNLDTTDTALLMYANAEFLFKQKKYSKCLMKLNEIELIFSGHSLIDEILLKKFNVFIETEEYENAISVLNKICLEHYYDILYDDALFYQAKIYEDIIKDNNRAKQKYEELLLKTPNSIFINEARKKYRSLRETNFLKL